MVLEIDPRVIAVARQYFCLPPDDPRLRVIEGDGARWLATQPDCADVVLVDGYDGGAGGELSARVLLAPRRGRLRGNGVLVVNLWGNDRRFDNYLQRIEGAFDGQVCCLPAAQRGNVVAHGFQAQASRHPLGRAARAGPPLEAVYGLEFPQFVGALKRLNPHTARSCLFEPAGMRMPPN